MHHTGTGLSQIPIHRNIEYGFPALGSSAEFEASSTCNYIDIFQCTDASNNKYWRHEEGMLDDSGLEKWIEKRPQNADAGGHVFAGGVRLLYAVCGFNPLFGCPTLPFTQAPFTQASFATVEDKFGLPEQFIEILTRSGARAFKTSCPENQGQNGFQPSTCFVFRFGIWRPNYYQLALSYDPRTHLTYGILLAKTKDHEFPKVIKAPKKKKKLCTHPLLVASLIIDLIVASSEDRLQTADWRLNELEETMGQHEYVNRPRGDPLEMDFISTTRTLNTTSRMLGVETMRLGSTILTLEMILKETRKLLLADDAEHGWKERDDSSKMIAEIAEYQMNACRNRILRAEYQEKRVQSQIAVVHQFMAQKDSKINISLAETSATIAQESKKDSSSMKAIAVLTMCFLPGTFLAAIFAMPLFNWDGDGLPVIKDAFRYYWAIAVPLTIAVLVLWALAMLLPWSLWLGQMQVGRRLVNVEAGRNKGAKVL